jgi:hypothetical protein
MTKKRRRSWNTPLGIDKKPEGHRWSPIVPDRRRRDPHACDSDSPYSGNSKQGRKDNDLIIYNQTQIYNYQSEFARYQKAMNLIPGIASVNGERRYRFESCNAPLGYWEVSISINGSFVDAIDGLIIVCPIPYQLSVNTDADDTGVIWTNVSDRLVVLDNANTKTPTLHILDSPDSPDPIILRVALVDDPGIFDEIIIFTRPIFYFLGWGAKAPEAEFCTAGSKVNPIVIGPLFTAKAYVPTELALYGGPPTEEGFQGVTVQQNIAGTYTTIDAILAPNPIQTIVPVDSYIQFVSVFSRRDKTQVCKTGPHFYGPGPNTKWVHNDIRIPGVGAGWNRRVIQKENRSVGILEFSANYSGLGAGQNLEVIFRAERTALLLSVNTTLDGIGAQCSGLTIEKVNRGGVIIG